MYKVGPGPASHQWNERLEPNDQGIVADQLILSVPANTKTPANGNLADGQQGIIGELHRQTEPELEIEFGGLLGPLKLP